MAATAAVAAIITRAPSVRTHRSIAMQNDQAERGCLARYRAKAGAVAAPCLVIKFRNIATLLVATGAVWFLA